MKKTKIVSLIGLVSLFAGLSSCSKRIDNNNSSISQSTSSTSSSSSSSEPKVEDNFIFTSDEDALGKYVSVSNITDDFKGENILIPDEINGIKDIRLEDGAFSNLTNIKSVKISKNVTYISTNALCGLENLEKLEVDSKNETYYSKDNCIIEKSNLAVIKGCKGAIIPEEVKQIKGFNDTNIESINIPKNVTAIWYNSFINCKKLSRITVDKENTIFEDYSSNVIVRKDTTNNDDGSITTYKTVWIGCSTSIIPEYEEVQYFGDYAFYGSGIKSIHIPANIIRLYSKNSYNSYAFQYSDLEEITFAQENSKLKSASLALLYTKIKNFVLPKGVQAFNLSYNPYLETYTLNDTDTIFDMSDVGHCPNFKRVIIDSNPNFTMDEANKCMYKKYSTTDRRKLLVANFQDEETINIDSTFTNIEGYAFKDNSKIKKITFNSALALEPNAFYNLENLENIDFGTAKITNSNHSAFVNCKKLGTITLNSNIPFDRFMFNDCEIQKVILSNNDSSSIDKIDSGFFNNTRVHEMELLPSTTSTSRYKLEDKQLLSSDGTRLFLIYDDVKDLVVKDTVTYISGTKTTYDLDSIKLPSKLQYMNYVYQNSKIEGELILPKTVTYIGYSNFNNSSLSSIIFPEGLDTGRVGNFYNAFKLKKVIFPSTYIKQIDMNFNSSSIEYIEIKAIKDTSEKYINYGNKLRASTLRELKFHGTKDDFINCITNSGSEDFKESYYECFTNKLYKLDLLDDNGNFYTINPLTLFEE